MTIDELTQAREDAGSDLDRIVLGDYFGAYSLGVSMDNNQPCLLLRVETADPKGFPETIALAGHKVPLKVEGNFKPPRPY